MGGQQAPPRCTLQFALHVQCYMRPSLPNAPPPMPQMSTSRGRGAAQQGCHALAAQSRHGPLGKVGGRRLGCCCILRLVLLVCILWLLIVIVLLVVVVVLLLLLLLLVLLLCMVPVLLVQRRRSPQHLAQVGLHVEGRRACTQLHRPLLIASLMPVPAVLTASATTCGTTLLMVLHARRQLLQRVARTARQRRRPAAHGAAAVGGVLARFRRCRGVACLAAAACKWRTTREFQDAVNVCFLPALGQPVLPAATRRAAFRRLGWGGSSPGPHCSTICRLVLRGKARGGVLEDLNVSLTLSNKPI